MGSRDTLKKPQFEPLSRDFEVKGGGTFTIDGALIVGTVNQDGSSSTGGNIDVTEGSDLPVNGNVIAVNRNTDALLG